MLMVTLTSVTVTALETTIDDSVGGVRTSGIAFGVSVEGGTARVDPRVVAAVARLSVVVNGAPAGRQSGSEPVADQVEPVSL